MIELQFVILGDPRTKKNSPRILYKGARCPVCKKGKLPFVKPSEAYEKYEAASLWLLRCRREKPIDQAVNVKCLYYMETQRAVDLNNLLEATCDILVKAHVLADDNSRIVAGHDGSRVLYDKGNPRVEITITAMGGDGDA